MTTPDTDPKVKELLESTKELSRVVDELWAKPPGPYAYAVAHEAVVRANAALAAFDPPKPKQYTMPTWEEFVEAAKQQGRYSGPGYDFSPEAVLFDGCAISRNYYNALREALVTETKEQV